MIEFCRLRQTWMALVIHSRESVNGEVRIVWTMRGVWLNEPVFLMLMVREKKTFRKENLFLSIGLLSYVFLRLFFRCLLELGNKGFIKPKDIIQ